MKKQDRKKLRLVHETVRALAEGPLTAVIGGSQLASAGQAYTCKSCPGGGTIPTEYQ